MISCESYRESMNYIESARETLKKAGSEDKSYIDVMYVQSACGTAYLGIMHILNELFDTMNLPKKHGRKSFKYYKNNLSKIDTQLLKYLNNAYDILYVGGYYEGITEIKIIEAGFENAVLLIDAVKSYNIDKE